MSFQTEDEYPKLTHGMTSLMWRSFGYALAFVAVLFVVAIIVTVVS